MTSEKKHLVKVTIVGDEYSIRSDETPEHTRAVAEHVDRAIRQVLHASPVVDMNRAAVMAALQITDELFRARAADERLNGEISAMSNEIRRWLPPAKRDTGEFPVVGP